jgi:glutaredoxin 3
MDTNFRKIKDFFKVTCFVLAGLTAGTAVNSLWAWYNEPTPYITIDTSEHFVGLEHNIVIYTASWCPYCKSLKRLLDERKVSYKEHDIEKADEGVLKLYISLGPKGVPKIVFPGRVYTGFNKELIEKELKNHIQDSNR